VITASMRLVLHKTPNQEGYVMPAASHLRRASYRSRESYAYK